MKRCSFLLILLLAGCAAQGVWMNPNKTEADFKLDKYNCVNDGQQYTANLGFNGNPLIAGQRARECMEAKGYTWHPQ